MFVIFQQISKARVDNYPLYTTIGHNGIVCLYNLNRLTTELFHTATGHNWVACKRCLNKFPSSLF